MAGPLDPDITRMSPAVVASPAPRVIEPDMVADVPVRISMDPEASELSPLAILT